MDWGGVFRDAINRATEDLFSSHLDLMLLCPIGVREDGINTDKYLPNPKHTSPRTLGMYEFVGKLMGMSLRLKLCLPFEFPSFVSAVRAESPSPTLSPHARVRALHPMCVTFSIGSCRWKSRPPWLADVCYSFAWGRVSFLIPPTGLEAVCWPAA